MEDHPEYTLLPFTPEGHPPKMTSASHVGQVFYFSKEKLRLLKEEAAPGGVCVRDTLAGDDWEAGGEAFVALLEDGGDLGDGGGGGEGEGEDVAEVAFGADSF